MRGAGGAGGTGGAGGVGVRLPAALLVGLALAAGVACGSNKNAGSGSSDMARADGEETRGGKVRVTGSTPFETVVLEGDSPGGSALELRGDYRDELKALDGATVRVTGSVADGNILLVSSYEIVLIAGERPIVGVLEVNAEDQVELRTSDGEVIRLKGLPAELGGRAGAKIWAILDSDGQVVAYGVIRDRVEG